MHARLQGNIWKYAVYLVTNKRTFMPILGVYLLTVPGATAQSVGLMVLVGFLSSFLFEIPSGYVSDRIGHKTALIFARISLLLSSLFFLVGTEIYVFLIGSALLNIGMAFHSGTGAAFMHETLRALGREKEYSKILGRISAIGFAVPIALIVVLPFFASISYKVPFMLVVLVDIIGLLVTASFVVPSGSRTEIKEIGIANFRKVLREGWESGFFKYAVFTAA